MEPIALRHFTLVNSLGRGVAATLRALHARTSGLQFCDFETADLNCYIGRVAGLENMPVVDRLGAYDCRNNRLAQLGLEQDNFVEAVHQAKMKYGSHRIGVIIGTSTAGIHVTEQAYQHKDPVTGELPHNYNYRTTHNTFSVADFTQQYLSLTGPAWAIATACSSSAKVFASAYRMMAANICDAVVVGGVDSLCLTTLYGFSSLGLVSTLPCRPCDKDRDGISIGEAAGFALLEKPTPGNQVLLLGYGESSDGYHMSSPHPEGLGALLAMERALTSANLTPQQIDYINLHGTASLANDSAEDKAVAQIFSKRIPSSSTKGWTGHTLGAAGITEAIIAALSIQNNFVPGTLNTQELDPQFQSRIDLENFSTGVKHAMSNSIGFGGNNCSLIFGAGVP